MDTSIVQLVIILLIILGIFGAKSTWALIRKLPEYLGMGIDSIEGLILSAVIFIAAFFIISPVMGVIVIIKKFI